MVDIIKLAKTYGIHVYWNSEPVKGFFLSKNGDGYLCDVYGNENLVSLGTNRLKVAMGIAYVKLSTDLVSYTPTGDLEVDFERNLGEIYEDAVDLLVSDELLYSAIEKYDTDPNDPYRKALQLEALRELSEEFKVPESVIFDKIRRLAFNGSRSYQTITYLKKLRPLS